VKLSPYQKRALYCHSSLPDDLGIQYQSYAANDVIASDDYITLRPGLGHTGNEPFDDFNGWYRSYRGLSGGVKYHAKWKGWSIPEHIKFPDPLRKAVYTMLLCEKRSFRDPNLVITPSNTPMQKQRKRSWSSALSSPAVSSLAPSMKLGRYHISSLPKDVIIYILEFMVNSCTFLFQLIFRSLTVCLFFCLEL
jgi:hypothetical protein